MNAYEIIKKPVLSEKGFAGVENKRYVFLVAPASSKPEIKKAIETIYEGVIVESVNTARYRGKMKRHGKHSGLTPSYKKAVVQLAHASKTIEGFDGLQ